MRSPGWRSRASTDPARGLTAAAGDEGEEGRSGAGGEGAADSCGAASEGHGVTVVREGFFRTGSSSTRVTGDEMEAGPSAGGGRRASCAQL
ncbi:hypothetical protein GCM10025875_00410 [Litorihabitans aurantiacus]|uniref:Uncharacterized protein n=1 Tax=Litorihabitans aurantiacus TaxID=1930061 RepID=A0AA37UKX0_9MICO|nr:hypothetical protein GCM10025875_00410 [Litorihabitans aurantiacus]